MGKMMGIKYFVNNLTNLLKSENRGCVLDVNIARRIKHIHMAFDKPLCVLRILRKFYNL